MPQIFHVKIVKELSIGSFFGVVKLWKRRNLLFRNIAINLKIIPMIERRIIKGKRSTAAILKNGNISEIQMVGSMVASVQ
ncbi:MAG: hypothetical protein Hyperionvirus2_201 [Hyperionvirus sp.]|uniref:Uncharacterized protein n=1 Tax=Hyperionvirus sp. TaxID=2487770 RepID=A0A3G5AAF7_9VIRU|nr:MAG: hypothetical protein Hyperionvirus2_201 [Hyperionvirus sp.]